MRAVATIAFAAILFACTIASSTTTWAEELGPSWGTDLDVAFAKSKKTGQPMLLYITSNHCVHCARMERDTLSDQTVSAEIAQGYIPVVVKFELNEVFVRKIGVRSFPTTMIVSPEAKVEAVMGGFVSAPELSKHLRSTRLARVVKPVR